MNYKIIKSVFLLNIIQSCIYLFGFFNSMALTTGNTPLVNTSHLWKNLNAVIFWSLLSMLCVIGFTITLYLLVSRAFPTNKSVGLIISTIGYASPIIFGFFLIIPATLLILGTIFCKLLILNDEKKQL